MPKKTLIGTALILALMSASPTARAADATSPFINKAIEGTSAEPTSPLPGANSFTESQARARIEDAGFANVTGLKKDDQGIWRGEAAKDSEPVRVALDYKGNVAAQ